MGALVAADPRRHPRLGARPRRRRSPRRRTSGAHRPLQRPVGLVHHRAPARLLRPATRLTSNGAAPDLPGGPDRARTRKLSGTGSSRPLSPSPAPGTAPAGTVHLPGLDQGPGYQLNVKTAGYPAGTWTLSFAASGDRQPTPPSS